MYIKRCSLPSDSLIIHALPEINYCDCFSGCFYSCGPVGLNEFALRLMHWNPFWLQVLVKIRNLLVKPLKLKTSDMIPPDLPEKISKGDHISIFEIMECNKNEILMQIIDKHLDVCISFRLENFQNQYEISVSTTVMFHNLTGRIYFFFIKPFHLVIMSCMLHKTISEYTSDSTI